MTLQQAYLKAVELPIKQLPFISLKCGEEILFLREDKIEGEITLFHPDNVCDGFYLSIKALMSDKWEVVIETK